MQLTHSLAQHLKRNLPSFTALTVTGALCWAFAIVISLGAAPSFAKQGLGEGCSAFKPCGDGLSCQPGMQKCFHKPRKRDEPCVLGHGCGDGLTCEAGTQKCVGPGAVGDACHLTKPCGSGLTCEAGRQKCVAPARDGESCHATKPCGSGLTCMPGSQTCSAAGRPIALPNDFPPAAAAKPAARRTSDCDESKDHKCHSAVVIERTANVPTNCLYGWNVGAGHPSSDSNPPDYSNLLNALDQCAYFHDRGAWKFNRNTLTCEHWTGCSNSMGLSRCMERYKPRNKAEEDAKTCFVQNFAGAMKACVPALYPDWGAEFATAPSGEQWLSAKSIAELRGALRQCPSAMANPGFPLR
jgi:hypothetical protein